MAFWGEKNLNFCLLVAGCFLFFIASTLPPSERQPQVQLHSPQQQLATTAINSWRIFSCVFVSISTQLNCVLVTAWHSFMLASQHPCHETRRKHIHTHTHTRCVWLCAHCYACTQAHVSLTHCEIKFHSNWVAFTNTCTDTDTHTHTPT